MAATLPNADAEIAALAGLDSDADKVPYFTGPGEAAVADFTAFARSLVAAPDAATARGVLGAAAASHSHSKGGIPSAVAYEDEPNIFTQNQVIQGNLDVTGSVNFNADKADLPAAIAYEDEANTFTLAQAFPNAGVTFGADTNLYRSAADVLKTDDRFQAGNGVIVGTGGTVQPLLTRDTSGALLVSTNANVNDSSSLFRVANDTGTTRLTLLDNGELGIGIDPVYTGAKLQLPVTTTAAGGINFGGDISLYRSAADVLTLEDRLRIVRALSNDLAITAEVTGDTHARFYINSSGNLVWGPGNATQDVNLYRSAADTLKTDDAFIIGGATLSIPTGYASIRHSAASNAILTGSVVADAQDRLRIEAGGVIRFGSGSAVQDTNLYRGGTDVLKTDDAFYSVGNLESDTNLVLKGGSSYLSLRAAASSGQQLSAFRVSTDTVDRFKWNAAGKLEWGDGTLAVDTNLYRSGADALKTDDSFTAPTINGTSSVHAGTTARVSDAIMGSIKNGNALEWGHTNAAGYRNTLASDVGAGNGFLAFHGEAGTTNNTYRTRGVKASILRSDNAGGFYFGNTANANADNQAFTTLAYLNANGMIQLPTAGNTGGLLIGNDTNLYRWTNDVLATDDSLYVQGVNLRLLNAAPQIVLTDQTSSSNPFLVSKATGDTNNRMVMRANGTIEWGSGSAGVDTNLYRNAADVLKTDDSFTVGATLNVAGAGGAMISGGDVETSVAAKGLIVKSPDGLLRRRLRIDNAGALVIEAA